VGPAVSSGKAISTLIPCHFVVEEQRERVTAKIPLVCHSRSKAQGGLKTIESEAASHFFFVEV
jgi:hypothetical protein